MQQRQAINPELLRAIESVFDRHRKKWLEYLARFLSSPSDAEDVLHEAVWRVMMRNRSFGSEDQLRMYLGRSIANVAIQLYHFRKKERFSHDPVDSDSCPAAHPLNPQEMMEYMEEVERKERAMYLMRKGLDRLPPKQYQALYLTYLDPGHSSIREAGTLSGIPYSTLRHRSKQGLRKLRKFLGVTMRHPAAVPVAACAHPYDRRHRSGGMA